MLKNCIRRIKACQGQPKKIPEGKIHAPPGFQNLETAL
jgi:hypothetical protein